MGKAQSNVCFARSAVFFLGAALAAWPLQGQSDVTTEAGPRQMTISADLLHHPISEKARRTLRRALETMKSGDHEAAIEQLHGALAKYPGSAAYTHSLLGVEYLKTGRCADAVSSFEQAVMLLPHDAVNRYNLGLSLVCAGEYERGEQELRRALELNPRNAPGETLLNALLERKRSGN